MSEARVRQEQSQALALALHEYSSCTAYIDTFAYISAASLAWSPTHQPGELTPAAAGSATLSALPPCPPPCSAPGPVPAGARECGGRAVGSGRRLRAAQPTASATTSAPSCATGWACVGSSAERTASRSTSGGACLGSEDTGDAVGVSGAREWKGWWGGVGGRGARELPRPTAEAECALYYMHTDPFQAESTRTATRV